MDPVVRKGLPTSPSIYKVKNTKDVDFESQVIGYSCLLRVYQNETFTQLMEFEYTQS